MEILLDILLRMKNDDNTAVPEFSEHDDLSGQKLPHGYRTEIRKLIQDCHFVIPKPELVPASLERAKEILSEITGGGYEINQDFVEARSLATVAVIILEDVLSEEG